MCTLLARSTDKELGPGSRARYSYQLGSTCANTQRIWPAAGLAPQGRGVQGGNGEAVRQDGHEVCVKRTGAVFYWTSRVAPRAGFEPATHGLTVLSFLRLRCRPERKKRGVGEVRAVPVQYGRATDRA